MSNVTILVDVQMSINTTRQALLAFLSITTFLATSTQGRDVIKALLTPIDKGDKTTSISEYLRAILL